MYLGIEITPLIASARTTVSLHFSLTAIINPLSAFAALYLARFPCVGGGRQALRFTFHVSTLSFRELPFDKNRSVDDPALYLPVDATKVYRLPPSLCWSRLWHWISEWKGVTYGDFANDSVAAVPEPSYGSRIGVTRKVIHPDFVGGKPRTCDCHNFRMAVQRMLRGLQQWAGLYVLSAFYYASVHHLSIAHSLASLFPTIIQAQKYEHLLLPNQQPRRT